MLNYKKLWIYLGRFSLLHVFVYTVFASIFLIVQNSIPVAQRVALDFYLPYHAFSVEAVFMQLIRGLVCAFVLYPFYDTLVKGRKGMMVIFGSMWGLALFASVEPMPGSIEGMIYTITTFLEHILVIVFVAIQTLIFVILFAKWEIKTKKIEDSEESILYSIKETFGVKSKILKKYLFRFSLLHLITYWVIGSIFYEIAGYEAALATMEELALFRPLENIGMVFAVFFGQIIRGPIIALFLYPFYNTYIKKNHGWLLLFGLIFGLTALGSPIFIPALLVFDMPLMDYLRSLVIGVPEIFFQMLIFSILFFYWQRRAN